jgi:MerR family mercuric resistance operon transcriptional regulator
MSQSEFRIGEVAAQAGVSIDTVRYYERRRLLPRVSRTRGGYRLFTQEAIGRIHFIKQAQDIGLSLSSTLSIFCKSIED